MRYHFPGRRIVDAMVDLPFALPTAVAGIALDALYANNGWLGSLLEPLGIKVAFTPLGVIVALIFIGLPFVVRTVQPVLADLEAELEEAAASLGAIGGADVSPCHPARYCCPRSHRLCARLCPRPGRIRLGHFHLRQHAGACRKSLRC